MKKIKLNITKEKSNLDLGSMFGGMAAAMAGGVNNIIIEDNQNPPTEEIIDGDFKEIPNDESIPVEFSTDEENSEPVFDTEFDNKDDPEPVSTRELSDNEIPITNGSINFDELNDKLNEVADDIEFEEPDPFEIYSFSIFSLDSYIIDNNNVVTLSFLCKDNDNNTIIIGRNYIIDTIEEDMMVKSIPFHSCHYDPSKNILNKMLMDTIPAYVTDFTYVLDSLEEDKEKTVEKVYFTALNCEAKKRRKIIFNNMSILADMSFIDNYVYECVTNLYDLSLAYNEGYSNEYDKTSIFVVDEINSLSSLVPVTTTEKLFHSSKKDSYVAFLLNVKTNKEGIEPNKLLMYFNVSAKFNKKKFRGKTINDIYAGFFQDKDHFLSRLYINNVHFEGLDKTYMVIKSVNPNNECVLFLFDYDKREEIVKLIEEY